MYYNIVVHMKKEIPYFLALFQGQDLIINAKVDRLSARPNQPFGYIEIIWIKCEDKEWLIDLDKQTIECKNGAKKHCRVAKFKRKINPIVWSNNRIDHVKYFVDTIFGKILTISYRRQIHPCFNQKFFEKYGNFDNCFGALISKEKVRYLKELKEIII